jgi:hypothetical protein
LTTVCWVARGLNHQASSDNCQQHGMKLVDVSQSSVQSALFAYANTLWRYGTNDKIYVAATNYGACPFISNPTYFSVFFTHQYSCFSSTFYSFCEYNEYANSGNNNYGGGYTTNNYGGNNNYPGRVDSSFCQNTKAIYNNVGRYLKHGCVVSQQLNYEQASSYCQQRGMILLDANSQEMRTVFPSYAFEVLGNGVDYEEYWINGYTFGGRCSSIYRSGQLWPFTTDACYKTKKFFCEYNNQ